ncbi:transcription-repair coupling factor [hydrocarbon metagenome]|uniref:Transcription-repair coupling factor n=1 Tax=hydrocarbon metagenome TaxID=938273 RepID=A0A0W8FVB2_9ZZZZ
MVTEFSLIEKINSLNTFQKFYEEIEKLSPDTSRLYVSSLPDSVKSIIIKKLSERENSILLLSPDIKSVNETKVELIILGLEKFVIAIDKFDEETIQERLTEINQKEKLILISTYNILQTRLPSIDSIKKNTTKIVSGTEFSYDELIEYLSLLNYDKDRFVDGPGCFAVRGSIIDFWSYSEKQPCRLEYDGDFIESIRYFDPDTQRSFNRIESVTLASSLEDIKSEYSSHIFDYLYNPIVFASLYEIEKLFIKKVLAEEIHSDDYLDDELKAELYEDEPEENNNNNEEVVEDLFLPAKDVLFSKNARWIIEDELGRFENRIDTKISEVPPVNSNFELLFSLLSNYSRKGFETIITTENELQARRMTELLSEFKTDLRDLIDESKIKIEVLAIKTGFVCKDEKLAVLSDYQIFNKPYRTKISERQKYKKSRAKEFASLKIGDYVVHETFGIGRYAGLETIKIGEIEQESIKIIYAEGGVVYVNLNYLSLVKKFSSKDNAEPKLSVLGSNEWKAAKKKVKNKIKDAARELIKLYAKRKASQGFSFNPDTVWQKELEASFFYEDTPDQSKVTDEVKGDMESSNPMDRLVCGDVGFGKTEIAVRAAFKAVSDGKQVALLVPTTILAEQHYNTFRDRLAQFPVKVEVISRFKTKAQQTEIVKELANGNIDVIIGTHRILSKDIKFKDLGLLIIDEEHRFGVMAKEKLRTYRANVDTLTLTATPIPRTLNLSLLGARDLSIIATPPLNRQPIYTKVDKFDITNIRKWILNEIHRDGQVYFVHDRVQSIDKIAAYLEKHIPEINIAVAHGQMKPSQLEKVIYDFLNKKHHMLISTKIIESGLDIPNVNTIIINRADRFGLAELHQLRGRVGRSDRQAYAYLIVPSLKSLAKKAVRRLQAIEEYTDLGEGFSLSMRDLEIRGAGNLLGTEQSGTIDTVGFDMYVKLLDDAVEELKHEEFQEVFKDLPKPKERTEPKIDTYFEIGIPKNYMPDQSDRLSFYTALFSVLKEEEFAETIEEMEDRFGKFPKIVEQLIKAAKLRFFASFAMFERIIIQRKKLIFILPKGEFEDFYKNRFPGFLKWILDVHSKDVRFLQNNETMKLEIDNKFSDASDTLEFAIRFCKEVDKVINNSIQTEQTGSIQTAKQSA